MSLVVVLLVMFSTSAHCFVRGISRERLISKVLRTFSSISSSPHWKDGVSFGCTGCGRCCQNEGEVWLNTEEISSIVSDLKLPADDVLNLYSEEVRGGWIKLKSKELPKDGNHESSMTHKEQCIFLDSNGKTCSIYKSRPIQCRTYPYWPRLLSNQSEWDDEIVVPDDEKGKHWSPATGGCEGINHKSAQIVPPHQVYMNSRLYDLYYSKFPLMSLAQDRGKLLESVDFTNRVIECSKQWVKEFVIGYRLCPFAEKVFSQKSVRYVASALTTEDEFVEKLKYEILHLLAHNERDVSTTLLLMPFLKPDFEDFYSFSIYVEEVVLPSILEEIDDDLASLLQSPQSNLPSTEAECIPTKSATNSDIQLAFFHPAFVWGDSAEDLRNPLHFEKRSPFPTVNLLRSKIIREYASQMSSKRIAEANKSVLRRQGIEKLTKQFERILQSALET